jgi:hypothetical protein
METSTLQDGRWSSVLARISAVADLEVSSRHYGALRRVRKIRSAEGLLRLALMYGPGHLSLRHAAVAAGDAGIAELSDKGVLGRLRNMGDWLAYLLQRLLAEKRADWQAVEPGQLDLALVDGSVICGPASKGADWRLHARFDPGRGCFGDLVLSEGRIAERVDRTQISPGQTMIQDRGYARVRNFAAILQAKSDFITRIGWRSVRLLNAAGGVVDVLDIAPPDDAPHEHEVYIEGIAQPLRLIMQRVPPEKAGRAAKRVRRKAAKTGVRMDPRTSLAAGYLMLLTSLPASRQPPERIISLYRNRWQVELGFKRLKTIGGLDKLPASDPALARTWLLAHLIAAVLTDEIANEIVGFPPSAG